MRIVVQRVTSASVTVDGQCVGAIGHGLLLFVGASKTDTDRDVGYLASKVAGLRIFSDEAGLMNCSILDVEGAILSVSQFTLYGDCRRGRRPSFVRAASPEPAKQLYADFNKELRRLGVPVQTGVFQADMRVQLVNDGPVTILLDSEKMI
tara:strand:- start:467 stop:916 length:450 start_codon:yes stop_codon:yes gene_type:complete